MTKTDVTLVTGASGFIGRHLIEAMVQAGFNVLAVDRRTPSVFNPAVEYVQCSVTNEHEMSRLIRRATAVIHLAAVSRVALAELIPAETMASNVASTALILDCISRTKAPMLLASSREVYGYGSTVGRCYENDTTCRPNNVYGLSKLHAEQLCQHFCKRYGAQVIALRLSNVIGPYDTDRVIPTFAKAILAGQQLQVYGNSYLDFVSVQYVVDAILHWRRHLSRNFKELQKVCNSSDLAVCNVGGGLSYFVEDIAYMMYDALGIRPQPLAHLAPRNFETDWYVPGLNRCSTLFGPTHPVMLDDLKGVCQYIRENYEGPVCRTSS